MLLLQIQESVKFYEYTSVGLGSLLLIVLGWYFIISNGNAIRIWKALSDLGAGFAEINRKIDVNYTDETANRGFINEKIGEHTEQIESLRVQVEDVKGKVSVLDDMKIGVGDVKKKINLIEKTLEKIEADHVRIHKGLTSFETPKP